MLGGIRFLQKEFLVQYYDMYVRPYDGSYEKFVTSAYVITTAYVIQPLA